MFLFGVLNVASLSTSRQFPSGGMTHYGLQIRIGAPFHFKVKGHVRQGNIFGALSGCRCSRTKAGSTRWTTAGFLP